MKKENFVKTSRAIQLLGEVLTNYECGESHEERIEILQAFNTLSDMIQKPKGKDNLKKIDSFMGAFYVYFNEYNELVILDSDKKQICFLENIDDSKVFDIYNQLEAMKNPMDLFSLSFCAEIYFDNDMENFVKNLKKYELFETSNPQSEIFRIGLFLVFFVY
jgi:hypothetical protein